MCQTCDGRRCRSLHRKSKDYPGESIITSDAMEIDEDIVHKSGEEGRLPPHISFEIESSSDDDELDYTPVLFESEDNEDDSEEGDEDNRQRTESEEDDLEYFLKNLANMQSSISFLAFTNCRNKTTNGLGCHLCFVLLQISIEYKRYVV